MLTAALNPNHTKINLQRTHTDPSIFKKMLASWVNFSQFVISTYAVSNSRAQRWTNEWVNMETKRAVFSNYNYKYHLESAQSRIKSPLTLPGVINRGMHLACLAGLYALHQYSKNTAYGLIGAMVVTKIASNIYVNMDFTPKEAD